MPMVPFSSPKSGDRPLTVGVATTTSDGDSFTLGSDGQFTYDPGTSFNALSVGQTARGSTIYSVAGGSCGSVNATLSIVISGLNNVPVVNDDALVVGEGSTLFGSLTVDNGNGAHSDPDASDEPFVGAVNGQAMGIGQRIRLASGALPTVDGSGTFSYDPNGAFEFLSAGVNAVDFFTYQVSDGNGGTHDATVSVTLTGVNDAPDAVDDIRGVGVHSTLSDNVLLDNGNRADCDPDKGDVLAVTVLNSSVAALGGATTLVSDAVVTLNADGSFDYTIRDRNGGTDKATVILTIR